MVYSGAWGKLIHEKNQKSKISWHCPFNKNNRKVVFVSFDYFMETWKTPRRTETDSLFAITVPIPKFI